MRYPVEYDRERNVNTRVYWDCAHKRGKDKTPKSAVVVRKAAEEIAKLPPLPVVEYGFGRYHLGLFVGTDRWRGYDISHVAVAEARGLGLDARVGRCGDAEKPNGCYVAAFEIIEHLDREEMDVFLETIKPAARVFLSVPLARKRDERFPQHMRGFGLAKEIEGFFRAYWNDIVVTLVRPHWFLAVCQGAT